MPETAKNYAFKNTNRWDTRQLVTMALMCAIGVILSFIEFPIFPAAPFLKYDASLVPAMVSGFVWGPGAGIVVGVVEAIIHGLMMGDFAGAVMNIIVTIAFVLPAAAIYRRRHTLKGAILALVIGVICHVAAAIVGNLIITPLWMGVPVDVVIAMILPILLPFNLLKAVLNSILTLVVYKAISNLIKPTKEQTSGKRP